MEQQGKGPNNVKEEQGVKSVQKMEPPRKCPRCESDDTKFCYYNNYSSSQPRYFCKTCRRYWTHGGALRNIPAGGRRRKAKRTKKASALPYPSKSPSQAPSTQTQQVQPVADSVLLMALPSIQSFNQMGALDSSNMCLLQDHLGVGFNPSLHVHDGRQFYHKGTADNLIYQSNGITSSDGSVFGQEQTRWDQGFIDSMMTIRNTGTGTSCGTSDGNINNNYVATSPYVEQDHQWFGHQNLPGYGPRP